MESPEGVLKEQTDFYKPREIQIPCPHCKETGHIIENSKIIIVRDYYGPDFKDSFRLDLDVKHCPKCKGLGYHIKKEY